MSNSNQYWRSSLNRLAGRVVGNTDASRLMQKYDALFSDFYISLVPPRYALKDILQLDHIAVADCQRVTLLKPTANIEHYRLHFYSRLERYLDEYIPVLENLNLRVMDQVQFSVNTSDGVSYIKSFTVKAELGRDVDFVKIKQRLLDAIQAVMDERVENDPLNKLIVLCGLSWHEVDVLRAYRNYFMQLGQRSSRDSIHHALTRNPGAAYSLFRYFEARFRPDPDWSDPMIREEQGLLPLRLQLLDSMAIVSDLNDDRILRTIFNLIDATMRSNYHQRKKLDDYFIAFKVNSLGVIEMPLPKPQFEIYVHSVDMEGIHLRAGKISRGGIRWSDRPDDFRTEILDLMQTQISKNSLIIPTGAKGGFVVKTVPASLTVKEAAQRAYIRLIEGLLDLTDNYDGDSISRCHEIIAYDDADPYLVVAADKGTAQFSDVANSVSEHYRFWLGDAFASGGSRGYNHKALGITARGAWECIKRHFRELGKDIQNEPFTVVGIGSMDGDVFGNGMLLSEFILLKAAVSGQHIFLDPNPSDHVGSLRERKRLFELAGSSWNDYDRTLISRGGGVYLRSDKDIPVSPEIRKWLGIRYKTLDGESLIHYLLTASVELLWLGGIGTYVKSTLEKHEEVGDRANDNVRVDAANLKARVVGEGANLGFTQLARIEFALHGGHINTDAVDNSAGVDISDHEVNLKILLSALRKKRLMADGQSLFHDMTDVVCRLVLADNYAQSLSLSLDQIRCSANSAAYVQLAERLEDAGLFDRAVESFPSSKEVLVRPGQVITRPELAVLMAASKRYLTQMLEKSTDWLDQDFCNSYLLDYFPDSIIDSYKDHVAGHPLARAIKATLISNKIINQAGSIFLYSNSETGYGTALDRVSCYLTFERVLEADQFRTSVCALDNRVPAEIQYRMLMKLEDLLATFCRWAQSRERRILPNAEIIQCYRGHLQNYRKYYELQQLNDSSVLSNERMTADMQAGVPDKLVQSVRFLDGLDDFPMILEWATDRGSDLVTVWQKYDEVWQFLELNSVEQAISNIAVQDVWTHKASSYLLYDLKDSAGQLLKQMIDQGESSCASFFSGNGRQSLLTHYRRLTREIQSLNPVSLLPYVVLEKELAKLCRIH